MEQEKQKYRGKKVVLIDIKTHKGISAIAKKYNMSIESLVDNIIKQFLLQHKW